MSDALARMSDVPLGMNVPDIAHAFASSGMFKDVRDQAQGITKILAGRSLGLDPFTSMSGLHVMQGKIEIGAGILAASIKRSPKYNYKVVVKNTTVCRLEFFEDGESQGVEEFTIADADAAGLTRNATWKKFPKNMLFSRCISNGYKTYCPDAMETLASVYVEGEIGGPVAEPAQVEARVITDEEVNEHAQELMGVKVAKLGPDPTSTGDSAALTPAEQPLSAYATSPDERQQPVAATSRPPGPSSKAPLPPIEQEPVVQQMQQATGAHNMAPPAPRPLDADGLDPVARKLDLLISQLNGKARHTALDFYNKVESPEQEAKLMAWVERKLEEQKSGSLFAAPQGGGH